MISATGTFAAPPGTVIVPNTVPVPVTSCTLEEAAGKWPSDMRFTRPLAMLYATFGKGREAVRTIERYLAEQPDDADALYVALEWLYNVRSAGAVVHGKAEDLRLAQTYAADYERLGGKQMSLVKQWLGYLQNDGRNDR